MRCTAVLSILLILAAAAHAQSTPSTVTLLKVTSLADSGPGTLRDCVSKPFPRACLFEVSGRIRLSSSLDIVQPDLVIAGQTAPSPGILITNSTVHVKARNVTIEHVTIRAGDDKGGTPAGQRDALAVQTEKAQNVTLRNLSLSWGIDENFSTYGPVQDVRVEDSILSEALYHSLHPEGAHSMGALVGDSARNVSFIGNLFAANNDRNVRWKFDTTGEMVSNVIYGWGGTSSWNITNISDLENTDKPTLLDVIGNVYVPGPGGTKNPTVVYAQKTSDESRVYMQDNVAPGLTNLDSQNISKTRVGGSTNEEEPANQAYETVLKNAGSRPWDRSPDDLRVIAGVRARSLGIRDAVGEWPVVAANTRALELPSPRLTLSDLDAFLASFERWELVAGKQAPTAAPLPTAGTPTPSGASVNLDAVGNVPAPSATSAPQARRAGGETIVQGAPEAPAPTTPITHRRAWIRSKRAWRAADDHLCCSRSGWRELSGVSRFYPSVVHRCEQLACARRVGWRERIR